MIDKNSIDWRKTTFEGNRCGQLKRTQAMTVRQRLQALDELRELSERLLVMPRETGQVFDNHEAINVQERHACDPEGSDSVF